MLISYIFKDFYYKESYFRNKSQKNVTFKTSLNHTSLNQSFTYPLANFYTGTIDFVPFLTILQKFFLLLDN